MRNSIAGVDIRICVRVSGRLGGFVERQIED
jgi:hypothetical protein